MYKNSMIFLIAIFLMPIAYSTSITDLIGKYIFSAASSQINVTNYTDFMVDKNNNGINDTLVIELTANSTGGNFIFVVDLSDRNGILVNETNATLSYGINKLNITYSSIFLFQSQFNYSIKIYNSTHGLKYRKDSILTQNYPSYEEGFRITDIKDSKINKKLRINVSLSSPSNETHRFTLFLSYNNQSIFSKIDKSIKSSINYLIFDFDNETIKMTHYTGNFVVPSLKIGTKSIKTNFTTAFYDFRDFAAESYISNISDSGIDMDNDGKYDFLEISTKMQITENNYYTLAFGLYDLFGSIIETTNVSSFMNAGNNTVASRINGSKIYDKKLNGPFIVKFIELFKNNILIDRINDAYVTGNYNFNDFESQGLPDLNINISISDGYHYGISNITINFTFKNTGKIQAFNVFTDIFDNKTFLLNNKSNIMNANSQIAYQINFANISDFEINAIADSQNLVEESNESNNAERIIIKLNRRPSLALISNMTFNETDKIAINLSAYDPNGDNISFSINNSKFSINSNMLEWNTTTIDSGNYTLSATASDGFLNDSALFKIVILDVPEKDADNDGIDDSVDKLIGNENSVNTSTINLTVFLGNSSNLSGLFNKSIKVRLMDGNLTIAEFDFDFSLYRLNLKNMTINKQLSNSTGSLLVRGLKMPIGSTKTLYLNKINSSINGICVKDDEISAIDEISNSCSLNNEFKIECDGTLQNSYSCSYNSTISKYKIKGLRHSGIVQIAYSKPAESGSSSSAGGGSGGGSSGVACISDWKCNGWAGCINGFQNRECYDNNQCAFPANKPIEQQQCVVNGSQIVNLLKPLEYANEYANKGISRIKKYVSSKLAGITGKTIKPQSYGKPDFGIFIVFLEVFVIVGSYLMMKAILSKMFK